MLSNFVFYQLHEIGYRNNLSGKYIKLILPILLKNDKTSGQFHRTGKPTNLLCTEYRLTTRISCGVCWGLVDLQQKFAKQHFLLTSLVTLGPEPNFIKLFSKKGCLTKFCSGSTKPNTHHIAFLAGYPFWLITKYSMLSKFVCLPTLRILAQVSVKLQK